MVATWPGTPLSARDSGIHSRAHSLVRALVNSSRGGIGIKLPFAMRRPADASSRYRAAAWISQCSKSAGKTLSFVLRESSRGRRAPYAAARSSADRRLTALEFLGLFV